MKKTTRTLVAALVTAPMLLIGLAACASGPASPAATTTSGVQGSSAGGDSERNDWNLKMVQCLRAEGVEIEDPKDGNFPDMKGSSEVIAAAKKTCGARVGEPPMSGGKISAEEALITGTAFAQCARDAGYDVTDPTPEMAVTINDDMPDDAIERCMQVSEKALKK